jgi:hypothetical protein
LSNERQEIEEHGFITDEFLANDPDCPVFGINLACAYPFPPSVESAYAALAARLAGLDEGAYVYPLWETHVTLITFLSFSRHRQPTPEQLEEMRSLFRSIREMLNYVFDNEQIHPFEIELGPPALSRKAGILPVANPSGEIPRIRRRAGQMLEGRPALRDRLARGGLNVPGIMHSTILRFKRAPQDARRFLAGFDAVAAAARPFSFRVDELYLTAETKPYMRGGDIMHRFALPL